MLDIVNWTLRNKLQLNFNRNLNIFIQENALHNVVCETPSILSRPQCVKHSDILCLPWIVPHSMTTMFLSDHFIISISYVTKYDPVSLAYSILLEVYHHHILTEINCPPFCRWNVPNFCFCIEMAMFWSICQYSIEIYFSEDNQQKTIHEVDNRKAIDQYLHPYGPVFHPYMRHSMNSRPLYNTHTHAHIQISHKQNNEYWIRYTVSVHCWTCVTQTWQEHGPPHTHGIWSSFFSGITRFSMFDKSRNTHIDPIEINHFVFWCIFYLLIRCKIARQFPKEVNWI